jgi:GNAT superfamily N-acetyltransferase
MRIRFIRSRQTHRMRFLVLHAHQMLEDCDYPNDVNPESFHLGAYLQEQELAVASFYKEKHAALRGWKQYRSRGLAVHPHHRRQGVGRQLLTFALDHLKPQGIDLIWCNVRQDAEPFYVAMGFSAQGPPFEREGTGLHVLMSKAL